jgi:hypothetical protein
MNTQKSIYEKLFKNEQATELASHKIDLGVVEDIASSTAKANKFEADILSLVKDADTATAQLKTIQDNLTKQIASIQKLATDAEKNYDAQDKIWDKAKIAAENLGLKKEDIKGWKEFENSRLTIRKAFDAANKFRK